MSNFVQDSIYTQCESTNALYEKFNDDETGHIFQCFSCNYMQVYRENVDSGKVVEDYNGYNHAYIAEGEKLDE